MNGHVVLRCSAGPTWPPYRTTPRAVYRAAARIGRFCDDASGVPEWQNRLVQER
uniref:Uncharacterized protein n=1 Tax=Streptomyces variabilis TaxID=67372 RepID=A0A0U3TKV6_9ACTN|nr:hypothetical protein [Streptomyces variabilis]